MPATAAVQESVAVPEFVMLFGTIAPQLRPEGTVSVKLTVPVNPFSAVTDRVDVPVLDTETVTGEVALIAKSLGALKVNGAVVE